MNEVLAATIAAVATVVTLVVSIWASRRFGLPGLAREVDTQQEQLIKVLRENNVRLAKDNRRLRGRNRTLTKDNQDLRLKLATAFGDIAVLYRERGIAVPGHVLETIIELKDQATPDPDVDEDDLGELAAEGAPA